MRSGFPRHMRTAVAALKISDSAPRITSRGATKRCLSRNAETGLYMSLTSGSRAEHDMLETRSIAIEQPAEAAVGLTTPASCFRSRMSTPLPAPN
jgi:hypothetical protein